MGIVLTIQSGGTFKRNKVQGDNIEIEFGKNVEIEDNIFKQHKTKTTTSKLKSSTALTTIANLATIASFAIGLN